MITAGPISEEDALTKGQGEEELPIALIKPTRACVKPITYAITNYLNYRKASPNYRSFLTTLHQTVIPTTAAEASQYPHWKQAMDEDMEALIKNKTWDVVELKQGIKLVGCRWVFTIKYNSDGTIERYKARLVAKGYTQTYGIDYKETFAPVAKMNTIRILISLAINLDWLLLQYDIKNAFLHGDLNEDIYMKILGYEESSGTSRACRLRKALYGLKQSPRAWFGKFTQTMRILGYKQCNGDHTLFFKHFETGGDTILIVYVDDIIITGSNTKEAARLEKHLTTAFEVKALGRLKYFLGIEIAYSNKGYLMTQQKYILDLLNETKLLQAKVSDTPIETNHKLMFKEDDPKIEMESFHRLIGKLLYLSHTRPDISYSVNVLTQFMHSPRRSHYQAALRVLRYLKGTVGLGLTFKKTGKLDIAIYTDSDYGGSLVDRRSTTGYCTVFGGNLVTWRSKKQSIVSKSRTEAEFRAFSSGIDEVLWIRGILKDLHIHYEEPIRVFCDNKSAICIAHDPVNHDRTTHIDIDRFYIKEKIEEKILSIEYIPSAEQCADVLTKGLPTKQFHSLISKLGMMSIHSRA